MFQAIIANVCSIIFVHGSTGDRDKTWTSQGQVLWPQDLLSKDVPTARVLTWGYDAENLFSRHGQMQHIGRTLVRDIRFRRKNTVTPAGRPIVFVAHGIGGLVVEQVRQIPCIQSVEDIANIDYYEGFG